MRNPYLILFLLVMAALVTLGGFLVFPMPEGAVGGAHPDYPSMNRGGDFQRHEGRLIFGWLYGSLQMALFVLCVWLGVRRGGHGKRWVFLLGLVYWMTFSALMWSYSEGVDTAPMFLGFPAPTAWILFGMWPMAGVFALLYTVCYRRWIFTEEDAERLETLRARYAVEEGERDDA